MILDQFKLDGKVAIVTGGSRGLGLGIALGLAEAGADIALVDILDMAEGKAQVEKLGRRCITITADLSRKDCVDGIVDTTVDKLGGLDILVNNAGIIRRAPLLEFTEKDWDDVMNINIRTLFFLSQAACRVMVKQSRGGKIINTASMLSFQGGILVPSYTASKSAVMGLTRLLAKRDGPAQDQCQRPSPRVYGRPITPKLCAKTRPRNKAILDRIRPTLGQAGRTFRGSCGLFGRPRRPNTSAAISCRRCGWLAR
jgi:2-deoxy-D-gluconate 3-dehydrogenase